jgi:hypothetical protein
MCVWFVCVLWCVCVEPGVSGVCVVCIFCVVVCVIYSVLCVFVVCDLV